jgi:rubredoxin
MGKYTVEVTCTISYTKTFEVEASDRSTAIDRAEQLACDTDMTSGSCGGTEYNSEVMETPEDRGECPECGEKLTVEMLEGSDETSLEEGPKHCKECGWKE